MSGFLTARALTLSSPLLCHRQACQVQGHRHWSKESDSFFPAFNLYAMLDLKPSLCRHPARYTHARRHCPHFVESSYCPPQPLAADTFLASAHPSFGSSDGRSGWHLRWATLHLPYGHSAPPKISKTTHLPYTHPHASWTFTARNRGKTPYFVTQISANRSLFVR